MIEKYDKQLELKRRMDGSIEINRASPFNSLRTHNILTLKNVYFGRWVRDKLIKMDTQRNSVIQDVYNKNLNKKKQDDTVTQEISQFITSGGDKIVL